MFTKATFIQTIDVLRKQHDLDRSYCTSIEKAISATDVQSYDNSLLVNQMFSLLQGQFPPNGPDCEIERFCYELNFGFVGGKQVLTAADLWDALHNIKPLPLIIETAKETE